MDFASRHPRWRVADLCGTWLLAKTNPSASAVALMDRHASLHSAARTSRETTAWCALYSLVSAVFLWAHSSSRRFAVTACWAAALFFLERALVAQQRGAWLGVGIAMGLGMLSKYSIGLVGLAAGLFLLVDASSRRWFLRWEPYAATLLAFALFSPVILWNAQHDWASFSYQAGRVGADPRFSTDELILYIAALLTPTGLAGLLIFAFLKNADTAVRARQILFMKVFTAAPFAVCAFFSLRYAIKLWWTGPIWLAALPALARGLWQVRQRASDRWVRASWLPTVIICALGMEFFHTYAPGAAGIGYSAQMNLLPAAGANSRDRWIWLRRVSKAK